MGVAADSLVAGDVAEGECGEGAGDRAGDQLHVGGVRMVVERQVAAAEGAGGAGRGELDQGPARQRAAGEDAAAVVGGEAPDDVGVVLVAGDLGRELLRGPSGSLCGSFGSRIQPGQSRALQLQGSASSRGNA